MAKNYVDHQGLGETKIRGQDGFLQVVEAARTYRDVRITIEDLIAAGDRAALRLRWEGINDTGRTVTRETIDILRFVDGRLTEHWGAQLYRREN